MSPLRAGHASFTINEMDEFGDSPLAGDEVSQLRRKVQVQAAQIQSLNETVSSQQVALASEPSAEEMEALRREWQTSEELFAQSQKDNEQKHGTIESLKLHVKALEHLLEQTLGPTWKADHHIHAPVPAPTSFPASTPLPLPTPRSARPLSMLSASQRPGSVSQASKRRLHARHASALDFGTTATVRAMGEFGIGPDVAETTPRTAMRKLEGGVTASQAMVATRLMAPPVTPSVAVKSFEEKTPIQAVPPMALDDSPAISLATTVTASTVEHTTASSTNPASADVAGLLRPIQDIQPDLAYLFQAVCTAGLAHEQNVEVQRQQAEAHAASRKVWEAALDAAQKRADEREARISAMLTMAQRQTART
ncbi:hypothetical protein Q5752_005777 [Cryptotrichosporon argae]